MLEDCNNEYLVACQSVSDHTVWTIRGDQNRTTTTWKEAASACQENSGEKFGIPENPWQNQKLLEVATGRRLWLNFATSTRGK